LLCILLGVLWIAGGASRADVLGQVVVRAVAWSLLVVAILFGERPRLGAARPVLFLLSAALLLPLLQLIPLPPGMWQALPGRTLLAEAAAASGQPQPWRPWSIVPGATFNAASSLVVPFAILLFAVGLKEAERAWLPALLLGLVAASAFVGLLQFASGGLDNPFVNNTVGEVSGTFANRNHFALFLALGCVLAPVWAFAGGRRPGWRAPLALGLVLLFALMLLTTGSRAGLVLGAVAIAAGLLLVRRGIRQELRRYPRWVFPALLAGLVALVAIIALASVAADRAVSLDRILEADQGQDMRARGLPTVLEMIRTYFPFGSGLGGFDPLFRVHEPLSVLKFTYFNHAHNDFLEIALDAGLPGLLVLAAGLIWWGWNGVKAWRGASRDPLPRAGAVVVLLILMASLVDYPARTPLVMAVAILATLWLAGRPALPPETQHL
jgi:O-antigen ligase